MDREWILGVDWFVCKILIRNSFFRFTFASVYYTIDFQTRVNRMKEMRSIDELIDENQDFHGVMFYLIPDKQYEEVWKVNYLDFGETEFHEREMGYKHYIMFFNDDGTVECTEAILSNPATYLKNLLGGKNEGLIMKKCEESEVVVKKHMIRMIINGLKNYTSFMFNRGDENVGSKLDA